MLDLIVTLDASVFLFINSLPHPAWLTLVMRAASTVSDGSSLWIALALILGLRGNPEAAFRVILALVATAVVVGVFLKPAIGRDRPTVAHDAVAYTTIPQTASLPSGHAAGAGAGAYALSRTWWSARPLLWGAALAVAVSRVYLGVHYPLDILVGLLVGVACARFVTGGWIYGGREGP